MLGTTTEEGSQINRQSKSFLKKIAKECVDRLSTSLVGSHVETSTTDQTHVIINVLN